MAGIYFGAGGVKKVKNIYFGAGGVKKIKKGWIGVGGVPKLFYSSEVELSATSTFLSDYLLYRANTAGSFAIGNYAVFYTKSAGGTASVHTSNVITAYNASLTRSQPTSPTPNYILGRARGYVGNYALLAGGNYNDGNEDGVNYNISDVCAYNSSLTMTKSALTMTNADMPYGNVGSYCVFASGTHFYAGAINASLTATALSSYNMGRNGSANSKYAIFGGGTGNPSIYMKGRAFDANLTITELSEVSYSRYAPATGCVSDTVIFVGGHTIDTNNTCHTVIEGYTNTLTKINAGTLSIARTNTRYSHVTIDGCMFIFGGSSTKWSSAAMNTVIKIDSNMTITNLSSVMQSNRIDSAVEKVGNYIVIGGGYSSAKNSGNNYQDVEYFTIS